MVPNPAGYMLSHPVLTSQYQSVVDLTDFVIRAPNRVRRQQRSSSGPFSQARLAIDGDESAQPMTKPELLVFFGVLLLDLAAGCYMVIIGQQDTLHSICNVKLASALRTGGTCAIVQVVSMLIAEWLRKLPEHCANRYVRESCYSTRCFLVLAAMAVVLPLFWAISAAIGTVVDLRAKPESLCDPIFVYSPIVLAVPFCVSCLIVVVSCN